MKKGTVVKLKTSCLDNPPETVGVCYEEYNIGESGAGSVIFANGNYDGFSPSEQEEFLVKIGFDYDIANYQFKNVMQLSKDYSNGVFDKIFNPTKHQSPATKHPFPSVLLIDDNETDNFINRKVLQSVGITDILTFTNPKIAIQHLCTSTTPHIILLDIHFPSHDLLLMPFAFTFLDDLQQLSYQIAFLTCSIHPSDIAEATKRGIPYIEKPLTKEKLLTLLSSPHLKGAGG